MRILLEKTTYFKYKVDFEDSNFNRALSFCRLLKNKLGWENFNFTEKAWRFNDPKIIKFFKNEFPKLKIDKEVFLNSEQLRLKEEKDKILDEKINQIKLANKSNIKIKGIRGKLYEFQKIAVEFLMFNNGRGMLAYDVGLGKTLISLTFVVNANKKKTLIISPASVKYAWQNEANKWTKLKSFVINSNKSFDINDYQKNDLIILNYDILKKYFDLLNSLHFDCLILDESSYVKNPKAIRSKLTKKISQNINSVILLTATPILAKPIELYQQLNIIDPDVWNNYYSYAKRYAAMWQAPWGMDVSGASNIPELKKRINKYIFRKRKQEVLKELPDKNFIDIPIELNKEIKEKYKLLENSFIDYLREIKRKNNDEIRKSMQAQALVKLGELRQLTSLAKINQAKEIIQNIIDANEKIVVFSVYQQPLINLQSIFKKESVILTGSISINKRQMAIDKFQNDDKIKVFLGGMLSANVGITLTAASNILFIDMDWTPSNMYQAIGRLDRIGQKANKINIFQLIALNTIDQRVVEILKKKQNLINFLIEDKNKIISNNSNTIIKDLFSFYA